MKYFEDFGEKLEVIEADHIMNKASLFGNYFYTMTENDIEALRKGKVLYALDEYGVFIALEPERTCLDKGD